MGYDNKINKEVFDFNRREIEHLIQYNSKLLRRIDKSFKYVYDKFKTLGNFIDITKLTEVDFNEANLNEGKNYEWLAVQSGNTEMIFRKYGSHITIFMKNNDGYVETCAFYFITDKNKLDDDSQWDEYCDNGFIDLNTHIFEIVKNASEPHRLDCIDLPKRCEIEIAYINEQITSIDRLMFCAEELSSVNMLFYSENEMLDMIKVLSKRENVIGRTLGFVETIVGFKTEVVGDSYHSVGILVKDRDGKEKITDVYSLVYYQYETFMSIYNADEYSEVKLSDIIKTPDLQSATITVNKDNTCDISFFYKNNEEPNPIKKNFKSLNVDVEIEDTDLSTVEHLGYKRYRHLVNEEFYINLYNY